MSDNNTPTPAAAAAPAAPEATAGNGKRRRALTALAAVVIVAGGGWGLYEWLVASHYEDTDNAYVSGNVIQITPQIGGTVMAINADDTDFVKAGQPLVQLDPADAKVAHQLVLAQHCAGCQAQRHDAIAQGQVCPLGEQPVGRLRRYGTAGVLWYVTNHGGGDARPTLGSSDI